MIGLQTGEAERAGGGNSHRQVERGFARRHAAAVGADVDLHQDVQARAERVGGAVQFLDVLRVVDADRDPGMAGEGGETLELAPAGDLVADQHVRHATQHHRFGFRHLLAADADGAERHLLHRHDGRAVGFGMRAHPDAGGIDDARHLRQIPLEGVEVDDQRRGIHLL